MSIVGFIVMGDRTSHGGTVVSGDMSFTIDGQPVARVGDQVYCPRCKMPTVIVTSRFPFVTAFAQYAAYDQDATSCGAILQSRHNGHAGWEIEGEENDRLGVRVPVSEGKAIDELGEYSSRKPLRFQEHFILHDEAGQLIPHVPYSARTGEGRVFEGVTDAEGRTAIIWTDSPEALEITVGPQPSRTPDTYHRDEQDYEGL